VNYNKYKKDKPAGGLITNSFETIKTMMDMQADDIAYYNADKEAYVSAAERYDTAYNQSAYFDSLIFNGIFASNFTRVQIPKRPCRPSLPNKYTGYFLNLTLQGEADLIA
jgi:hypothetical protein